MLSVLSMNGVIELPDRHQIHPAADPHRLKLSYLLKFQILIYAVSRKPSIFNLQLPNLVPRNPTGC